MMEEKVVIDFNRDKEYIEKEIIAKQPNGNYCKFSRVLHAVVDYNIQGKSYIDYWKARHKSNVENCKNIELVCKEKLENGLTSVEDMIKLVQLSDDRKSYKKTVIDYLIGREEKSLDNKILSQYKDKKLGKVQNEEVCEVEDKDEIETK